MPKFAFWIVSANAAWLPLKVVVWSCPEHCLHFNRRHPFAANMNLPEHLRTQHAEAAESERSTEWWQRYLTYANLRRRIHASPPNSELTMSSVDGSGTDATLTLVLVNTKLSSS